MISKGKVCVFLLHYLLTVQGEIFLPYFGLEPIPQGVGHIFHSFRVLNVDFDVNLELGENPKLLDCSKYNIDPNLGKGRTKRSIENLETFSTCAYQFEQTPESQILSEKEEVFWRNLMSEGNFTYIYCDNGYSDNCLLRAIHTPDASYFWHKKFNHKNKNFIIEPSYVIYQNRKNISISKEILYRQDNMIELVQQNQDLLISYHCLGNPYNKLEKDPLINYVEANKANLLWTNFRTNPQNTSKTVSYRSSKNIILGRVLENENIPTEIVDDLEKVEYLKLNRIIKKELESLNIIEKLINDEIIKLNEKPVLLNENNEVSNQCKKWFEKKELIILTYKKREELIKLNRNYDIQMSNDLKNVCAQGAFIKLQKNAIDDIERLKVDLIQKEILTLLNISFEINENDHFKINSKIENFKNSKEFDSFKFEIIEVNKQKFRLQQDIDILNTQVARLQMALEIKEQNLNHIKNIVQDIKNKTSTQLNTKITLENTLKAYNITKSNIKEKIENVLNKIAEQTKTVNKLTFPSKYFYIRKSYEIIDKEGVKESLDTHKNLRKQLNEIDNNITNILTITEEYTKLLSESNITLSFVKNQLAENETIYNDHIKLINKQQEQIEKLNTQLTKINEEWDSKYNALMIQKRSVDSELEEYRKESNESVAERQLKKQLQAIEEEVGEIKFSKQNEARKRRNVQEKLGLNIYNYCEQVNSKIQDILVNIENENARLNKGIKKRSAQAININTGKGGMLDTIWKIASTAGIVYEYFSRKRDQGTIDSTIRRNYEEFLETTKLNLKMDGELNTITKYVDKNLEDLNIFMKNTSSTIKELMENIDEIKDYTIANRVWIVFYEELMNLQRMMMNELQRGMVKSRIIQALTTLRSGMLPMDFISIGELQNLLIKTEKQLPSNLRLAFNESEALMYYQYPLTRLNYINGRKYIVINLPVIEASKENEKYELNKMRAHPTQCLDKNICDGNKKYVLELKEPYVFTIGNQLVHTTSKEEIECLGHFNNKMCWTFGQEKVDNCLDSILNRRSIENCKMKEDRSPPMNSYQEEYYQTMYDQAGILVGQVKNEAKEITTNITLQQWISDYSTKSQKLQAVYKTDTAYANYKTALNNINLYDEKVKELYKKYHNRTIADMVKETGIDSIVGASSTHTINGNAWYTNILMVAPYILAMAILILHGNWITIATVGVVARVPASQALELKEVREFVTNHTTKRVQEGINNYFYEIYRSRVEDLIILISIILFIYIVYRTLFKLVNVDIHYGTVTHYHNNARTKWYLMTSTTIKQNTILGQNKTIINIAYDVGGFTKDIYYCPAIKTVWLKEDNEVFKLVNRIPIEEIHTNEFVNSGLITVKFRENEIHWEEDNKPDSSTLSKIHSRTTIVSLVKRANNQYLKYKNMNETPFQSRDG